MSDFKPFEPAVMDNLFILADARTRKGPAGVMVDAINFPARRNAALLLGDAISEKSGDSMMDSTWRTMHCLFALFSLKMQPPIMMLVAPPAKPKEIDGLLKAEIASPTKRGIFGILPRLGALAENDETMKRRLSRLRSYAWSSNVPGIVCYVDWE